MGGNTTPTDKQLVKFFGTDAICWQAALRKYDETRNHKKNKAKKNYMLLRSDDSTVTSAETLVEAARNAYSKAIENRGKGSIIFHQIVSCLQVHAHAINVFIQAEPKVTALVWGSIRLLLQVVVDSEQASELTAEGILLVAQHSGRWCKMAHCFGYDKSVEEALTDLYVHVLDFLFSAIHRFQKGTCARLIESTYSSAKQKFAAKLGKLRDAADRLDRTVQSESNEHNKQANQAILSLLQETPKDTARIMMEAWAFYQDKQGRYPASLDIGKVRDWIDQLSNPVVAPPDGIASAAEIDDAEPWIVRHPTYLKWQKPDSSGLLWVSGPPGCGKSTLAFRTVEIAKRQHSSVVSHAFQNNVSAQHRCLVGLAASILNQLLPSTYFLNESQQIAYGRLLPLCHQFKSRPEDCPFEKLWGLCVSLLKGERDFILVVDALDECAFNKPNQAPSLLEEISALIDCTAGKVVIFTRPNAVFDVGTTSQPHDNEIRITIEDTLPELNACCDAASKELSLPGPLQLQVANQAKAKAQGSFLWAKLFIEELSNCYDMEAVRKTMVEFPDNCWDHYFKTWCERFGKLDTTKKAVCQNILLILLGARRKLTLGELEDAIGLLPNTAPLIILKFCQPLVRDTEDGLQLSHGSVRDFLLHADKKAKAVGIGFSQSEPDAALTRRTIKCLLEDDYSNEDRIGQLLRRNIGHGGSIEDSEKGFYDYAARNWFIHLTSLSNPDPSLLELAGRFLRAPQFAYWAEYSYTDAGDFQAIRSTEIALTVWLKGLPERHKDLVHLEAYFERPYSDLNKAYKERSGDNVLQWLALMRLGFYYFDRGRMTEMAIVREEVSVGLSELLGPRHPLTLQARSDAAYTPLFNGRLQEARKRYAEVVKDQQEVADDEDPSPFFTLIFQAQAEYLSTNSEAALVTLGTALAGFIRTTGPQSNGFLVAQLWYAIVDSSLGHIDQAIKMLERVRDKRKEQYGPEDSFGIATQLFMGDLYRRIGKREEALANIEPGLKFRRGFWSISHFMTLDTALVLAIAYRDFGEDDMADTLVEELEKHANLEKEENFIRLCQVKHLRALLLFDRGEIDQPIRLLETLLIETSLQNNNRALQWIRLDLAFMIRYRGRECDERLASSLFDGIVTDQPEDGDEEPDPPRFLRVAEKALRLVRRGKLGEAEDVLREEKLRWAREEDLWMWLGVPPADTGWTKPPRGLGDDALTLSGWARLGC